MMSMFIDFLNKYYLDPIHLDGGYNFVNTTTYALLAVVILFLIYKLINRLKIKIDLRLFLSVVPFFVFGAITRSFADVNFFDKSFFSTYFLVSPGIYLLVTVIYMVVLTTSSFIEKRYGFPYWKQTAWVGILILALDIISKIGNMRLEKLGWAGVSLGIFFGVILLIYLVFRVIKWKFLLERLPFLAVCAHLFDATNTFVLTQFLGGWEKHPLPRYFIAQFGPASFFLLKLAFVIPAAYLIKTKLENKSLANFLLIVIAVLGFAQGLRNFATMILI